MSKGEEEGRKEEGKEGHQGEKFLEDLSIREGNTGTNQA